jgi:ribonuclease BN (tRNA processing enzyme)
MLQLEKIALRKIDGDFMKIHILGTRGEIDASTPYHSRHSGILIDNKLLFDLGEKEFLAYKPKLIFLTHLHPDHAYFVRAKQDFPQTQTPIYAPECYNTRTHKPDSCTKQASHPKKSVKKFKSPFKWHGYTITAIPTEHSLKVKSQAYLIEKNKRRVLYTGDLFWIKKKYQKLLGKLDLVITEASYAKEGGMIRRSKKVSAKKQTKKNPVRNIAQELSEPFGHTGVPNLVRLFAPYTKKIVLGHFGTWFFALGARKANAELAKLGKKYRITIIPGYDGMQITQPKAALE